VRQTFVALVLTLAVWGAGCSSQPSDTTRTHSGPPSAVAAAQKQVQVWSATDQADLRTLRAECPGTAISCVLAAPISNKLRVAESHFTQAVVTLERVDPSYPAPTLPATSGGAYFTIQCTCRTVVPNVVGESVATASATLRNLRLKPQTIGSTGEIVRFQHPVPGTKVLAESTIVITTRIPYPATMTAPTSNGPPMTTGNLKPNP
jgi:PASTA domain